MPFIAQGLGMCIQLTPVLSNNISQCLTSSVFKYCIISILIKNRALHTESDPVQQYSITLADTVLFKSTTVTSALSKTTSHWLTQSCSTAPQWYQCSPKQHHTGWHSPVQQHHSDISALQNSIHWLTQSCSTAPQWYQCSPKQHHTGWHSPVRQHHSDISALQNNITLADTVLFKSTTVTSVLSKTASHWLTQSCSTAPQWYQCSPKQHHTGWHSPVRQHHITSALSKTTSH